MFDILGLMDLAFHKNHNPSPESAFRYKPWSDNRKYERYSINSKSFQVIYLKREFDDYDYFFENGMHLFIIGEVFPNRALLAKKGKIRAEEIFHLYEENGINFLNHIKGNFVLVLLNEDIRKCRLFNSRFGILPFYYTIDNLAFVFSSSLTAIIKSLPIMPQVDMAAVAELALFNYPLGDRTYFRNIKMLRPGEIISADADGIKKEFYWDVRTLYDLTKFSRKDALEIGAELFHKIVNQLSEDVPKIRISFTSGFDSRAILSVLKKDPENYLTYSFGIPSSLNITIPQYISQQLGISYQPILLDETYENVFDEYAIQTLLLSDCLSTVERANYPYSFEKLEDFSPVILTGLFGSELMRTFQNIGHIVSQSFIRLYMSSDPLAELKKIIAESGQINYFAQNLLICATNDIEADVNNVLIEGFGEMASHRRLYMFLLTEGLRKYFGPEVHIERLYGINRFPFLDDEFVEFLFRSPFAGVHSRVLSPGIRNRYQSQYFYAYIIRKYRPELLYAPTDHGYAPIDLLSPLAMFVVGPKCLLARRWRRRNHYREFKTEEWTGELYKRVLFQKPVNKEYFSPALENDFSSGEWLKHRSEYARAASLKVWLEMLQ